MAKETTVKRQKMGENVYKSYIREGVNIHNTQEILKFNSKKINQNANKKQITLFKMDSFPNKI